MSKQLRLLPAFVMLLAGLIASIMTYINKYETKEALIIITATLVLFYILGSILQKVIHKFEEDNKPVEEVAEEVPEGTVSEKDVNLIPDVNLDETPTEGE